jgi:hypothetical protein
MAIPTLTASLNKATYAPGENMLLTINYADADSQSVSVTIVVTDAAGNSSAPVTVAAFIKDTTTLAVTEAGKTWTKISDNGAVAVYSRVA